MLSDRSLNHSYTPKPVGLARLSDTCLASEFVVGFVSCFFTNEGTHPSAGNPSPVAISAASPSTQLLSFHFQTILQTIQAINNKMAINGFTRIN